MKANEVRNSFLEFFKSKEHTIVPSAPVVPGEDPTLIFTNAGMNQFKDIFLGTDKREYSRAADSQKCIRVSGKHNDLEEVGVDFTHHTFFEMLGNWSFGDYYKKEAINWAWELITDVWKIDKNRLFATVYEEDDEAELLWAKETDIDPKRIYRCGKKDNFWEMGDTGPCGPCSEIHYDIRSDRSEDKSFYDLERDGEVVELWNLVFIQYNRQPDQSLVELPSKHVDTGMGFERITAVLQNTTSNYDTDVFTPILNAIEKVTGEKYVSDSKKGIAFRVIADHIRALSFAIADSALPSNDGRGYVLRRILRRASRYSRELGVTEPILFKLVQSVDESLGSHYPEIVEKVDYIARVIKSEEESFGRTLDRGIELFNEVAAKSGEIIPGSEAFKLYDTFGFPLDLTELMAREAGLSVDLEGFDKEMAAQKERSHAKKSMATMGDIKGSDIETSFNYDTEEIKTEIAAIHNDDGLAVEEAFEGQTIEIQLKGETPFYAESGGQLGDAGEFETNSGKVTVDDTQKATATTIFHIGKVLTGSIKVGEKVTAKVEPQRRGDIQKNHTATHLLHKALRDVLGTHVVQAGSLVSPDYLRFDFNHFQKVTDEELYDVEAQVNFVIRTNLTVNPQHDVPFDDAKEMGAMALFGEKYGDKVRVVMIGEHSRELCGGTHVKALGDIGEFRITSEASVATGVRRIIAETGAKATERTAMEREQLANAKSLLNARDEEITEKIEQLLKEKKELEKKLKEVRKESSKSDVDSMIEAARNAGTPPLIYCELEVETVDELKELGDVIRGKMPEGAALLGASFDGKAQLVCVVGDILMSEGKWKAGDIVKSVSKKVGGGGGGRPHMATAGIKYADKLSEAIGYLKSSVEELYG